MQEKVDFEVNNIICNTNVTQRDGLELNSDYNLPDYIDDIRKLDRYEVSSVIHNIFSNGSSVQCEGEVIYNILVICEDESIKNIIYSEDFAMSIVSKDNEATNEIFCSIASPQVRLTTQRRINCRSRVNIYERSCDTVSTNIHSDCDRNIERLTDSIDAVKEEYRYEYDLHASHDIELSSSAAEINNIVYCRVNTYISEIKYIDTQMALRGETRVEILYESEDGEYHYVTRNLPYSELTQAYHESAFPCLCKIKIKDIKACAQNNSFGEMRIFELDYSYDIEELFYITQEHEITRDAYSTEKCSDIINDRFEYKKFAESFCAPIRLDEIKEIPDYDEFMPANVIDTFCDIRSCDVSCDKDTGRYSVQGECELRLICKCGTDEQKSFCNVSYTLPFKYEREASSRPDHICIEQDINISDCQCNIEKGKMHITAELFFNCVICDTRTDEKVSELKHTNDEIEYRSPLTLYYPKDGDTLWNVAKRYRCARGDIIRANGIKDEDISNVKVMLIPFN